MPESLLFRRLLAVWKDWMPLLPWGL